MTHGRYSRLTYNGLAHSLLREIAALALGGVMMAVLLGFGFGRCVSGMPNASRNSVAIGAA